MRKSKTPNGYDFPIPEGIPPHALAYEWCLLKGRRDMMHASARRRLDDYDEAEYNRKIDESLAEYPDAPRAFPERPTRTDRMLDEAECRIRAFMDGGGPHQGMALGAARRWFPNPCEEYMNRLMSDRSVQERFCRMGSPGQNRLALEWLQRALWQADQS